MSMFFSDQKWCLDLFDSTKMVIVTVVDVDNCLRSTSFAPQTKLDIRVTQIAKEREKKLRDVNDSN